jgi:hypothetical protein
MILIAVLDRLENVGDVKRRKKRSLICPKDRELTAVNVAAQKNTKAKV